MKRDLKPVVEFLRGKLRMVEDREATAEIWAKAHRKVIRRRGKTFVVRDGWHHVALVRSYSSALKTYINGVEVGL